MTDPVVGKTYTVQTGTAETAAKGMATVSPGTKLTVVSIDEGSGAITVDAVGMTGTRGGDARTNITRADWDGLTFESETTGARRRRGKKTRARLSRKSRRRSTRRRT